MNSTWCTRFAVSLGMAYLILIPALAGTTTTTEVTYAREVGTTNALVTIPGAVFMTRVMAVFRPGGGPGNFFLRVGLGQNSEFDGTGLPVAADLTQTGEVCLLVMSSLRSPVRRLTETRSLTFWCRSLRILLPLRPLL